MFSHATRFSAVLALCAFMLFGTTVQADEVAPAASTAKPPPKKIPEIRISPPNNLYPPELVEKGVQGRVEVLIDLAADGSVIDASVQQSSRSEALDQTVLTYVKGVKFKTDENFKPGEIIIPFEFSRTSIATLKLKTCGEFNVDLQYFQATFPDKKIRDMPGMDLARGTVMALAISTERLRAYVKVSADAESAAFARCAKEPDAKFLQVLIESTESLMKNQGAAGG